ncbi:MAG: PBP1A family penicillin-binding protein [Bryobacterales bacterium]|nr:PBP1A family penicillin-binding protein [Bryobacteraceae bacterium]MDW8130968.1 PBP1A family penicillin-binding protein [Bryobacterales bacterium]
MAVRIQLSSRSLVARLLLHPLGRVLAVVSLLGALAGLCVFAYYYVKFSRLVDGKLRSGPFPSTSMIFAAPRTVNLGDAVTPEEIVAQLRRTGYGESRQSRMGWFHVRPDAVEIFPGPDSYFEQEPGVIKFAEGRVVEIISLRDNTPRTKYLLEPELITNLSDRNREKRRLVRFADLPKVLVDAIIAAEDKRFFQHAGFDPLRVIKAAYVDLKERRIQEGASTLSMQLARSFFLDYRRTWRRKAAEVLITLLLEQRLSKQQIFEYYVNQIPLGRHGSFNIHGFGEAALAYLGKDVRELTLPEAALLAGMVRGPSLYNPYRNPERARQRRNVVLALMRENGFITEQQYREATQAPLRLAPPGMESTDAPYFVDLVNDELSRQFQEHDFQGEAYRIYTTLDMDLQRAAAEAVRAGLQEIDERIRRRRRREPDLPDPQVALVALDPQSGAVKALIGGRNYGVSQLNRVLAKRQPGSAFKPFVYAAALETAVLGAHPVITPVTMITDEPTTFWFDNRPYTPSNYKNEYHGQVTLRDALAKSMNVATVKLAQMVGYDAVEALAERAGMNLRIEPTPAIALGAYEVTPLEIAGAYTVFANQGVYSRPYWITLVRDRAGNVIYTHRPVQRPVLDPRVAYIMVNLMEEVLRSGTGAGVRARGFLQPAAGKTGTSHDGWFAGFTSRLVCVVWVGFDDNRELNLEGAHSALPIWAEFMKRAAQLREYRNASDFQPPDGVISVEVDPLTGQLASPGCPARRLEVFVSGTEPTTLCRLHGGAVQVASWDIPPPAPAPPAVEAQPQRRVAQAAKPAPAAQPQAGPGAEPAREEKKGFFRRLLSVFK